MEAIATLSLMQICGLAGVMAYLGGFAGLQLGLLDGNGKGYCLANIAGAALVLVSLTEHFNLASALIQVSWIVIGLGGLGLRALQRPVAGL